MNYCQFRNLTIKRMSNAGENAYTPVEYLGCSGKQCIYTGIYATPYTAVSMDMQCLMLKEQERLYSGEGDSNNANIAAYISSSLKWSYTFSARGVYTNTIAADTNRHVITLDGYNQNFKIDNVTRSTFTRYNKDSALPIRLLAVNAEGDYGFVGKIYGCSISNNNSIIRNYTPAYRNKDHKPGLYDNITGEFLTNDGNSYDLTLPDANSLSYVTVSASDIQAVEYIQGTGTQWINTGIIPILSDNITSQYQFTALNGDNTLFYVDSGAYNKNAYGFSTYNTIYVEGWGTQTGVAGTADTNVHTLNINNGVFRIDGAQVYSSAQDPAAQYAIKIGSWYRDGAIFINGLVKIYSFEIAGKISLIPCYRISDGRTGMYDTTTGRFYYNQGYGEFTVGNNV